MIIGGKERKYKIGVNATILVCEKLDIDLNELTEYSQKNPFLIMRTVVWAGLKSGGEEVSEEQVGDWLDELGFEEGMKCVDVFFKDLLGEEKKKKKAVKK